VTPDEGRRTVWCLINLCYYMRPCGMESARGSLVLVALCAAAVACRLIIGGRLLIKYSWENNRNRATHFALYVCQL
jgi:hypothetical protein